VIKENRFKLNTLLISIAVVFTFALSIVDYANAANQRGPEETECPIDNVQLQVFLNAYGDSNITYYPHIGDAYAEISSLSCPYMRLQAITFAENPTLSKDSILFLYGGYECNFVSQPGFSTINGSLTISGGPVTVDNIIIK
jgi:hypothetical protein